MDQTSYHDYDSRLISYHIDKDNHKKMPIEILIKPIKSNPIVRRDLRQIARMSGGFIRDCSLPDLPTTEAQPSKGVAKTEGTKEYPGLGTSLKLLTISNPKTQKGLKYGYLTAVLHLAPANYSGHTACYRYKECAETCLYHQGRGKFPKVQAARIRKTKRFFEDQDAFFNDLCDDIHRLQRKCMKPDMPNLCIRLNALSDILWEDIPAVAGKNIFNWFPQVQFYDYTKYPWGHRRAWEDMPINYHLTYSYNGKESDIPNCEEVLSNGYNVNVVHSKINYKKALFNIKLSKQWKSTTNSMLKWGVPMRDNEQHDLRFTDPRPCVLVGCEKGYSDIAI